MKMKENEYAVYIVSYEITSHSTGREDRQKFYDYIDDQDFCAITESSCVISTLMSAKELFTQLIKYLQPDKDSLFIARIDGNYEMMLPIITIGKVRKWLKEHSF